MTTAASPPTRPYRFDERLRMIPVDPAGLAARVAAAHPVDFAGFRRLGIALMLLGRHDEALDQLDQALDLADTPRRRITVWINLADVYRYRGEPALAELLYRRALNASRAHDPDVVSFAAHHLGKSLAEQHQREEARQLLGEALRLRVADGDPELIESTTAALEHLDEMAIELPLSVARLVGTAPIWASSGPARAGDYWVVRGPRAIAEYQRLRYLASVGVAVPSVVEFAEDVLVTVHVAQLSLAELDDPVQVGATMGGVLRRLHALTDCPFDSGLDAMLPLAQRRVVEGLVDVTDFDDDHADLTPEQVIARVRVQRPAEDDHVVAHGDFTPENVLADGTMVDVAGVGVADRARDLAIAERELTALGEQALTAFYAEYGGVRPDQRLLDYYRLLDELC
ncbi:tetratricopeptide repeat protein [Nocardia camponoti]|uniref:Aminoglycoside phosphotransferase domain-containing protein n=1 Tax=Nocardia camponoti TaxID=1616106 RepID=A0A917QBS9_9NOCA|nr:tetratricopeptide repeat protein [Nocardia camponoti]GGK41768.1 hypothetical protein GCM10011591_11510 [Nocardia camponoti]